MDFISLTFCMFCKTHFFFVIFKYVPKGVPFEVIVIINISRNLFMFWCMRMKMIRKTILYQYKSFLLVYQNGNTLSKYSNPSYKLWN